MTKEELEEEAEEYADTVKCEWENDTYWIDCRDKVTDAYLAGAKPREKRIEELEEESKVLAQNLEDSEIIITGLTAQIEKMKVCQNCDNWNWKHNKCQKKLKGDCFKHSKWVMRNF